MEIIVSGLLAVGRGLLAVLNAVNTYEGFRIIAREIRRTKEREVR
ncbi:hypothetical protein ABTZ03_14230 [Kitasatospora sp. NPDC096077]